MGQKVAQSAKGQFAYASREKGGEVLIKGFQKTPPELWIQGKGEACSANKGDTSSMLEGIHKGKEHREGRIPLCSEIHNTSVLLKRRIKGVKNKVKS